MNADRIVKLKAHIKSRRGRRDFQALDTLVDLQEGFKKKRTTLRSMDAMLRCYYDEERAMLQSVTAALSRNQMFALIKKDESVDEVYVVPLTFLPEKDKP